MSLHADLYTLTYRLPRNTESQVFHAGEMDAGNLVVVDCVNSNVRLYFNAKLNGSAPWMCFKNVAKELAKGPPVCQFLQGRFLDDVELLSC